MQLGVLGKTIFKPAKSLSTWEKLQQTDGIAQDSPRMLVVFLGSTLQRKQRVNPPEGTAMVCFQQVEGSCNSNVELGSKFTQFGVEDLVLGLKECENTHKLTTKPTGSERSQKEVNNQTDNQNNALCPQKVPFLQVPLLQ